MIALIAVVPPLTGGPSAAQMASVVIGLSFLALTITAWVNLLRGARRDVGAKGHPSAPAGEALVAVPPWAL